MTVLQNSSCSIASELDWSRLEIGLGIRLERGPCFDPDYGGFVHKREVFIKLLLLKLIDIPPTLSPLLFKNFSFWLLVFFRSEVLKMKLSRGIKLEWSICFDMVMVVCHMHTFQRKPFNPIRALPSFEYMRLKYKRNCLQGSYMWK